MDLEREEFSVKITGKVQGVGYRAWLVRRAQELGITGCVSNQKDGSVQAVLQGEVTKIRELTELMKVGPDGARVAAVVAIQSKKRCEYLDFSIEL